MIVRLPDEVLRLIVEESAAESRGDALKLLSVSSSVKIWTEPLLYSEVVLGDDKQIASFTLALHSKMASEPAHYVRKLFVLCSVPFHLQDIYNAPMECPNLQHLALADLPHSSSLPGNTRLSRFTFCNTKPSRRMSNSLYNLYGNITHLHIINPSHAMDFKSIAQFTSLSYLVVEVTHPANVTLRRGEACLYSIALSSVLLATIGTSTAVSELFLRISSLRQIAMKIDLVRSQAEWEEPLRNVVEEEPRILLSLKMCDDSPKIGPNSTEFTRSRWQTRIWRALDEVKHLNKHNMIPCQTT
ncbi:hypothetical protein DFH11DRAFT_1745035 [Phellopilus nigrolimitatus]|nr:hypothetical protein DFH11DRAFT_1745035 [Phellopilus nigrolimitatus]